MKVTIETDYLIATVESKPEFHHVTSSEAADLKRLMVCAMLACEFEPATVADILDADFVMEKSIS